MTNRGFLAIFLLLLVMVACGPTPRPQATPSPVPAATEPARPEMETIIRQGIAMHPVADPQCWPGSTWRMSWSFVTWTEHPSCYEFVGMNWGVERTAGQTVRSVEEALERGQPYYQLLNECSDVAQCEAATEQVVAALAGWIDAIQEAELPVRLIVGGENSNCLARMQRVHDGLKEYYGEMPPEVAGWSFHIYPGVYPSGQLCADIPVAYFGVFQPDVDEHLKLFRGEVDKVVMQVALWGREDGRTYETWINELGCITCPADDNYLAAFMSGVLSHFNCPDCLGRVVNRHAWYTDFRPDLAFSTSFLFNAAGEPTAAGALFINWPVEEARPLPGYMTYFPVVGHPERPAPPEPGPAGPDAYPPPNEDDDG